MRNCGIKEISPNLKFNTNLYANIDFTSAWYGCESIESFPGLDLSSGTDFSRAWFNCNMLSMIDNEIKLRKYESNNANTDSAFYNTKLDSISIEIIAMFWTAESRNWINY